MPVPHQPIGQIDATDRADGYSAPTLVAIDLDALDWGA
jgi:hypothetical protein